MKNSVWYHKLWSKKLNKLPVRQSSDSAWEGMKSILDQHLPTEGVSDASPKLSPGSKLWTLVSYVLPAAAAVSALTYISLSDLNQTDIAPVSKKVVKGSVGEFTPAPSVKILDGVRDIAKPNIETTLQLSMEQAKKKTSRMLIPLDADTISVSRPTMYYPIYPNKIEESKSAPQNKEGKPNPTELTKNSRKNNWQLGKLSFQPSGYNLEAGVNFGLQGYSPYAALIADLPMNDRWYVSAGLRVNINQKIKGEFNHPSFYRPDSLRYSFSIQDERKFVLLDIPLKLNYRLSEVVSFNTGLIVSLPIVQSSISTKLGTVADRRDTLYQSKLINAALANSKSNNIHLGISGGIKLHVKSFDIVGGYQIMTPYRLQNDLGSFRLKQRYFQVGIGYQF